jgi:hypothetical protein
MSEQKFKNQIRALAICLALVTLIFGVLFCRLYYKSQQMTTEELTLKKLNLIGEDGTLRMVLSNEKRQNPGVIDGKPLAPRERPAGIIFFDNNGNECGGLTINQQEANGQIHKDMSFTMDNYRNDQVLQLVDEEFYKDGKAIVRRGMAINEFPVGATLTDLIASADSIKNLPDSLLRIRAMAALMEREGSKRRVFVGRTAEDESGLFLFDHKGRPRMQIYVDSLGNPQIFALDSSGNKRSLVRL